MSIYTKAKLNVVFELILFSQLLDEALEKSEFFPMIEPVQVIQCPEKTVKNDLI